MSEKNFATGGCLCGKINYSINSEPLFMGQCHCDDCRKTTGTGHASNAFFPKDSVTISGKATTHEIVTDSGSTLTRSFCSDCGSRLFSKNSVNKAVMGVTAGTFDNSDWFAPQFIVYNKSKPQWDCMDENVPTFESMPPAK